MSPKRFYSINFNYDAHIFGIGFKSTVISVRASESGLAEAVFRAVSVKLTGIADLTACRLAVTEAKLKETAMHVDA
jgi:hypothetical protein